QGDVEPVEFGKELGHSDDYEGELHFGTMVHGLSYPDETGQDELAVRLWKPVMKEGIIKFDRPEDCNLVRSLRPMYA
ncbi:type I-C CRISPR-associated protein Cas5c, partial [Enterococcus faecalis]